MIERTRPWLVALLTMAAALGAGRADARRADWVCPPGYAVKAGLNIDFPSDGKRRAFIVVPPENAARRVPVWVPLTGTVESTDANLHVARSGANAEMAKRGFMVIGPVRDCAVQNPKLSAGACNGVGRNGWNWNPWNDGRAASAEGAKWANDAGPDARFLKAMVRCVGTKWPLDRKRLFIGGISAGGTMTNRALLFDSDFWGGGLPISGEWYIGRDDHTPLRFNEARAAVAAAPTQIFQGRVGPQPLPARLGPMVVITVWGGERDLWNCGTVLCADYRPSTQAGANYFSAQPKIVHVACSATHGHMWPQVNTQAFNAWALATLASHPKGSRARDFALTSPPPGYQCRVGSYTDHY